MKMNNVEKFLKKNGFVLESRDVLQGDADLSAIDGIDVFKDDWIRDTEKLIIQYNEFEVLSIRYINGKIDKIIKSEKDLKDIIQGYVHFEKRMTERFNPPKGWDFEDMLNVNGIEYLSEEDSDYAPFSMDDFNELLDSPWEAVRSAFYGGRYGFKNDSFNPNDSYFRFNGYGNAESIPYLEDYLKDMIDEESFYDWCVEQGYFESDEDDE